MMKKLSILIMLLIATQGFAQKVSISKKTRNMYTTLMQQAQKEGKSEDDAIRMTLENSEYKKLLHADLAKANKKANKKGILFSKNFGYISLHKKVAILPFTTDITDNKTKKKKQSKKQRLEDEKDLAENAQEILYKQLMKRQFDYSVEFQDIKRTNQILKASGVLQTLTLTSDEQLAEILEVDAVIRGDFSQTIDRKSLISVNPMSTSNTGVLKLSIGDKETGDVLWRMDVERSKNDNDIDKVMNKMMDVISKSFPYSLSFEGNFSKKALSGAKWSVLLPSL